MVLLVLLLLIKVMSMITTNVSYAQKFHTPRIQFIKEKKNDQNLCEKLGHKIALI